MQANKSGAECHGDQPAGQIPHLKTHHESSTCKGPPAIDDVLGVEGSPLSSSIDGSFPYTPISPSAR